MKLVYILNQRFPTEKAYGIQVSQMCLAFSAGNIDVELLVPTRTSRESTDPFAYYDIEHSFKFTRVTSPDWYLRGKLDRFAFWVKNVISAFRLANIARSRGADVVYAREELPLLFLSFGRRRKLVMEVHRYSNSRAFLYRWLSRRGVRFVVIADGLRNELVASGISNSKVFTAHDAVNLEEFNIQESQESCRRKLALPVGKIIIGYVGQLRTMGMEKGLSELIHAVSMLKNEYPDLLLAIVGGSSEDIHDYELIAEEEGIRERILFMGRQEHKVIPYFLKAFDILTMPFPYNHHYAFNMSPLKLFEYMASGRPIVASDLPALREVLNDDNSILVKPDNVQALAVGIKNVLTDNELAARISQNAFEAVKHHTWENRAKNIINFI